MELSEKALKQLSHLVSVFQREHLEYDYETLESELDGLVGDKEAERSVYYYVDRSGDGCAYWSATASRLIQGLRARNIRYLPLEITFGPLKPGTFAKQVD